MLTLGAGYFVASFTFLAIDMVWLGLMASRFYRPILGEVALASVNLPAAAAFYGIYPVGLLLFAIHPALKSGSPLAALVWGGLFGFFTYATYDLTNQATLRNWSSVLSVVDVAWGTTLAATTSLITWL